MQSKKKKASSANSKVGAQASEESEIKKQVGRSKALEVSGQKTEARRKK